MERFAYANPTTIKEVTTLLNGNTWSDGAVLAGGTDLISMMKDHVMIPKRVINIKNVKELGGIRQTPKGLRIGATVTMDELASNQLVRAGYRSLVEAALGITSPQIRNMGTVGGDVCQRPRCWYFRQGYGVLGQQDGKPLIPTGQNKYHAIFPSGPAMFVSASSLGPALVAIGAKLVVASSEGTREVNAADFFVAPAAPDQREIALKPNELLTEILLPAAGKNATYEVRHKDALDWPLATASVNVKMTGAKVSAASIVLGHVAPVPYFAKAASAELVGKSIDEATAEEIGKRAVEAAAPLSQNSYKVQLAAVAVKRALLQAASKA
jgi:xanthine dehydrogenase YagS FAD-binding subunit